MGAKPVTHSNITVPPPCPRAQQLRWAVGGCCSAGCCSGRSCDSTDRNVSACALPDASRRLQKRDVDFDLQQIGDHGLVLLGRARAAVNRECDHGDESLVKVVAAHDVHVRVRLRALFSFSSITSGSEWAYFFCNPFL
ncbi:hypothetical protein PMAYCL1PPCAC_14285 [Pristionchus mayeri]|uniref:Uncharacterized protein n=1 Tax=Pristionchus mayeri TaxID=1317129 RepID=A0AAN5CFE1_9BILA|nr:hypothetical protein PMAYCL1PPCAC_14285 [Pristionchus mayeri]